jgi:hypothetical protein
MLAMDISGGLLRTARPRNEWFVDVDDPEAEIDLLKSDRYGRVDLFTFWQRVPAITPRFPYHREPEVVAALPLSSYDSWWKHQIDGKTRNLVRKAEKKGVVVRSAELDDSLVQGITRIFNETPIRQGRHFLHYGKKSDRVREEMADRPESSVFIGAYVGDALIGFVKLLLLADYAMMVEIISEIRHRDKAPNNALIAAAVLECTRRRIPFLTYSTWAGGTLASFKESNGFEKYALPRYYVPLTVRGRVALSCNLHRGVKLLVPKRVKDQLKDLRRRWYAKDRRSMKASEDGSQ